MINQNEILLETDRLILKKFEKTDFKNFLNIHLDSNVMKYFDGGAKTIAQTKKRFEEVLEHQTKYGFSYYGVFLKESEEYIGQTGLYYNYDMSVNLCFALHEKFHNFGYGFEMVSSILKFGFTTLNLSLITATASPANQASIRLLKKLGGIFTGKMTLYSGMQVFCFSIIKDNFLKILEEEKYRRAVGGMLINESSLIYLFQRKDFSDSWQCPEGGVENNESNLSAIYREIWEEVGISKEKLTLIAQTEKPFKYNYLNNETKFGYIGQEKQFFLFLFKGKETDFHFLNEEKPEFQNVTLFNKDQILEKVPSFKKELYSNIIKEFNNYLK